MTLSVAIRHTLPGFTLDARFEAPPGLTVLFGRSGSGKTTVINAVAGLIRPEAGRITTGDLVLFDHVAGVFLAPHRRRLGYIFQEGRLFPHLTVRQNLAFGRWFAPKSAPREDFDKVVEMLGIGHLLARRPALLSGGEKARVALGRALLAAPSLILADEPLAALDEPRKAEILPYFERLRDEIAVPILYVSHSAAEVARLATTVVVQGARRNPELSGEVGAVLETRVAAHHPDGLTELSAGGMALFVPQVARDPGQSIRIRISAHDVILSRQRPEGLSALNILEGTVETIRAGSGPGTIVSLATPAGRVLARITRRSAGALDLAPGSRCFAIVKSVAIAPEDVGATRARG